MCAIEAGDFRKFVIRDSVPTKNAFERAGEGEFDDRAAICHEYSGGRELLNDSIVTGLIISRHLITIFEFYYKISPVSGKRPRYATLASGLLAPIAQCLIGSAAGRSISVSPFHMKIRVRTVHPSSGCPLRSVWKTVPHESCTGTYQLFACQEKRYARRCWP